MKAAFQINATVHVYFDSQNSQKSAKLFPLQKPTYQERPQQSEIQKIRLFLPAYSPLLYSLKQPRWRQPPSSRSPLSFKTRQDVYSQKMAEEESIRATRYRAPGGDRGRCATMAPGPQLWSHRLQLQYSSDGCDGFQLDHGD